MTGKLTERKFSAAHDPVVTLSFPISVWFDHRPTTIRPFVEFLYLDRGKYRLMRANRGELCGATLRQRAWAHLGRRRETLLHADSCRSIQYSIDQHPLISARHMSTETASYTGTYVCKTLAAPSSSLAFYFRPAQATTVSRTAYPCTRSHFSG